MRKLIFGITTILLGSLLLSFCNQKSNYKGKVQKELAKGIRNDSLFLNIHFGMKKKDFYTECWKLNKQKLIQQGPGNLSVEYALDTGLRSKAFMRFYPAFDEEKIYEMPVAFNYEAWSPWNKELATDTLLLDVRDMLSRWYDAEFEKIQNPEGSKEAFVNINGNRRIMIFRYDHVTVKALFTDLVAKNEILKRNKKES